MEVTRILEFILLGAVLGMLGQGIRIIIGLTKKNAQTTGVDPKTPVNRKEMGAGILISVMIGAIAGSLGMLQFFNPENGISKEFIFTITICGYAGTDFIEGLLKSFKINFFGLNISI